MSTVFLFFMIIVNTETGQETNRLGVYKKAEDCINRLEMRINEYSGSKNKVKQALCITRKLK